MPNIKVIYLVVSGAGVADCVPDIIQQLNQIELPLYTLLTDNARNVISPSLLAKDQNHHLIDSYFDPALINGRQPGLTVVAPATFNTLNKIAQGIADTLAHSLVAEAIGAGWPVIIAPAMNAALANHPQVAHSLKTLRQWGVNILEPQPDGTSLIMASAQKIASTAQDILAATTPASVN